MSFEAYNAGASQGHPLVTGHRLPVSWERSWVRISEYSLPVCQATILLKLRPYFRFYVIQAPKLLYRILELIRSVSKGLLDDFLDSYPYREYWIASRLEDIRIG